MEGREEKDGRRGVEKGGRERKVRCERLVNDPVLTHSTYSPPHEAPANHSSRALRSGAAQCPFLCEWRISLSIARSLGGSMRVHFIALQG